MIPLMTSFLLTTMAMGDGTSALRLAPRAAIGLNVKAAADDLDLSMAAHFGEFAYTNARGLWVSTTTGTLVHVTANASADDPQWSANGRYLAYATSGTFGANPLLHLYDRSAKKVILTQAAYRFAWRPGHDLIAVVGATGIQLIAIHDRSTRLVKTLGGGTFDESHLIWSTHGVRLAYAVTRGKVGENHHDVVKEIQFGKDGATKPYTLFTSVANTGIWLAGFIPDSANILYWPDAQYSASLMADGAPLYLWLQATKQRTKFSLMLPFADYLSLDSSVQWAYMAGGLRVISGDKSIVLVTQGTSKKLYTPQGTEAIEPSLNPSTGVLAAVLAENNANAAWGLSTAYHQWMTTRRLAVWQDGAWHVWKNAGTGVTDPVWAADGQGLFYLAHNRLWFLHGPRTVPIALLGPIASSQGYYGEILRSSLWSLWSREN